MKATGGEDLQVEEPVSCRDGASFDFHPARPSMLGATLIRHEVVQVRQAPETRLLAAVRMMASLHHQAFPIDGVMGLIEPGAGHRHPGVGEHRRPARFFVLQPVLYARAMSCPSRGGDQMGQVASPLAQRKHS